MKLLIMGGTLFLGRAVVDQALELGIDVTIFNRGKTNPSLYPDVEHLVGDRDGDLAELDGRSFDAVIDTSGYFPRQVRAVVEALDAKIGHYTFVSTVSVYSDNSVVGATESDDVSAIDDPSVEELGPKYGGFKALCESALDELLPGRVHNVRAGLIFGPHDDTGRFGYWAHRIAAGGEVLAPGPRDYPVQFIDVRDLARWTLHAMANDVTGAINASGTPGAVTMDQLLTEMRAVSGSDAALTWVDEEFLLGHEVKPWNDLPLWIPPKAMPTHAGFMSRSNRRAADLGLELRPIADTIRGTLDSPPPPKKDFGNDVSQPGLTREREAELLHIFSTQS